MKQRTGYIYREGERWVARVTITDGLGCRRNAKRYRKTKTEARLALTALLRQLDERGEKAISGDQLTFGQAAGKYAELKLIPARYVDDVKVAGLRSMGTKIYLEVLKAHFGQRRLRAITHADIERFKLKRLATPKRGKKGGQRAIASVNRELELLRAIFNFAKRQDWIARSPFERGEPLIVKAAERSRDRILTFDEEESLLKVCVDRLAHLRPLIIAAVDTGLRRGELFKLEWGDIDLNSGLITLRALTTKTLKARTVAMTSRLQDELWRLWRESRAKSLDVVRNGELAFGVTDNIQHGFTSACRQAGLNGLRFHDLRHTAVSRLIAAGIGHAEAMRVSGHATLAMLNRYLNTGPEAAVRAAEALDQFRGQRVEKDELVN